MKRPSLVLHSHFYQPPRESPWTDRVPREMSAAPYHDWNRRVHDECYRAVVAARVLDDKGRIAHVMNTLEWMSWDAGATLLRWLARETPDTYRAFIAADARSVVRTGHGNALAAPYHHIILPLASYRDKVTEVRWGIRDFRRRFGRAPEGMWLPETAVDTETLEVLAQEGIRFTVVGPDQVTRRPPRGGPGRVLLSGGRSIAVFVYDGPLSHDVAFGKLLKDSDYWVQQLVAASRKKDLVSLATDGETFGHHHRWADMALAATLTQAGTRSDVRLENFAAFLERHPPKRKIQLVEPSSWSCAHGVDRWRKDCGCKMDPSQSSSQAWRSVLREALDRLGDDLHALFGEEGATLLKDPWAARDAYAEVFDAGTEAQFEFLERHCTATIDGGGRARALELLEMERDLLRMYTSCGWFFDDLDGLEPLQVLRYAAHALDLAGPGHEALEAELMARLQNAKPRAALRGTGATLWKTDVRGPDPTLTEPQVRQEPSAISRAVSDALRAPTMALAEEAEALLDEAGSIDLFDVQTAVARVVGENGPPNAAVSHLAARLGVAPDSPRPGLPGTGPIHFVFGLHVHQPVGNFDEVFRSHAEDVYLPFLRRVAERAFLPVTLHVSGPLLEWLDAAGHPYLDLIGRLADEGSLELLCSGFYEPVLPALSTPDRLEQIGWMKDWLSRRFGVDSRGLWLTERVWEPGLAHDLAEAGIDHVLVDDRHFLVTGIERHRLHRPWRTESGGGSLSVLPIDEHLRYLVPFRSTREIGAYLRGLAAAGHPMAVLADDGEKFGGWPGTAEWVWEKGWLERFLDEMETLAAEGVVRFSTPSEVVWNVPAAGLAYLPSASYREMERWSLPPDAVDGIEVAERALTQSHVSADILRGGHWRNFLVKYSESNRMHKKAQTLSELCRQRGDPPDARRAIGRAQCNDAYWHGVFGGLYLRHLRNAIWANLAEAERILRAGEPLQAEPTDLAGDAAPEIYVHSAAFSAVVRPHRGGTLVELTDFTSRVNLADTLTRRREAYHRVSSAPPPEHATETVEIPTDGMPSIHEIEEGLAFDSLPPVDPDERTILVDRVLGAEIDAQAYESARYDPLHSWADEAMEAALSVDGESAELTMMGTGPMALRKTLRFNAQGRVEVSYLWDPVSFPSDAVFAPELSLDHDPGVTFDPHPESIWRHDIVTVSKSESGAEESVQGLSLTPRWPISLGAATLVIPARSG